MKKRLIALLTSLMITMPLMNAWAEEDPFQVTTEIFRNAGESGHFFDISYGYAVFPTVGRAGVGIGGARGTGRVDV